MHKDEIVGYVIGFAVPTQKREASKEAFRRKVNTVYADSGNYETEKKETENQD